MHIFRHLEVHDSRKGAQILRTPSLPFALKTMMRPNPFLAVEENERALAAAVSSETRDEDTSSASDPNEMHHVAQDDEKAA
jgi:hypothetical protein